MNTYIVHPALVYAINVCGSIRVLSILLVLAAPVVTAIVSLVASYDDLDVPPWVIRLALWVVGVALTVVLFVPSRDVCIEMLIAKAAAKENVAMSVEALKSVVDYVISAIKGV